MSQELIQRKGKEGSHTIKSDEKKVVKPERPQKEWVSYVPLVLIVISTLFSLWLCIPKEDQWMPPVDHNAVFNQWIWAAPPPSVLDPFVSHVFQDELIQLSKFLVSPDSRVNVIGASDSGAKELVTYFTKHPEYQLTNASNNSTVVPSPFSVILHFNGESEITLRAEFSVLSNYLRLRTASQDWYEIVDAVIAWIYKQSNPLIIFHNCKLNPFHSKPSLPLPLDFRSTTTDNAFWLKKYLPRIGAKVIYISSEPLSSSIRKLVVPDLSDFTHTHDKLLTESINSRAQDKQNAIELMLNGKKKKSNLLFLFLAIQYPKQSIKGKQEPKLVLNSVLNTLKETKPSAYRLLKFCSLLSSYGISKEVLQWSDLRKEPFLHPRDISELSTLNLLSSSLIKLSAKPRTVYYMEPSLAVHIRSLMSTEELQHTQAQVLEVLSEIINWLPLIKYGIPPQFLEESGARSLLPPSAYILVYEAYPYHTYGDAFTVHSILLSLQNSPLSFLDPSISETPQFFKFLSFYTIFGHYLLYIQKIPSLALDSYEQTYSLLYHALKLKTSPQQPQQQTLTLNNNSTSVILQNKMIDVLNNLGIGSRLLNEIENINNEIKEKNVEKSLEYHQQASVIVSSLYGSDSFEYGYQLLLLGDVYKSKKDYAKANDCYQRALGIDTQVFGAKHLGPARDHSRLAKLYRDTGDIEKATLSYQSVVEIYAQLLGEHNPIVASQWDELGELWTNNGRTRQAVSIYQRSLEIWKKALDSFDPRLGNSYLNLAVAYQSLGWGRQARRLFQQAMTIEEESSGESRFIYAKRLALSADSCASIGRNDEALSTYQRSFSIYTKLVGEHHVAAKEIKIKIKQLEDLILTLKKMGKNVNTPQQD